MYGGDQTSANYIGQFMPYKYNDIYVCVYATQPQDRVAQVYGGLVYMDFSQDLMARHGHGRYEPLDPSLLDALPSLWLLYGDEASESGAVHADVRRRWDVGEAGVREGMAAIAGLAVRGRAALEAGDALIFSDLMDENFECRRALFGDAVVGAANLRMVAVARSAGAAAKLPGSGGAVVAMCRERGEAAEARLAAACAAAGVALTRIVVAPPRVTVPSLPPAAT